MNAVIAGIAPALASLALLAPAASAQDPGPAYTDWNPAQIGFPSNASASPRANCVNASGRCIDRTIGEMYRRFNTVVPGCDDNNVFSLTYIRVTEDIRTAGAEDFYPDEAWLNVQDAQFARSYFLAYDNYLAGRTELVPPSWRIAFDAGRDGSVEGIGNLLLSMNAHVNRDFPFILYHAGLVDQSGASRKAQHDSYNPRLRALYRPLIDELSARFDDSVDDYDVPGTTSDDEALFSVLVGWRETAWQNAQRLAAATSDAERRQVAESIEAYAVSQAELIYAGSAYGPGESTASRDALCASEGGQDPGYERGSDVAHFRSGGPLTRGGRLIVPVSCPNGPGPCVGVASARGAGRQFSFAPGARGTIRLAAPESGERGTVRLRSLLGPGVAVTKKRHTAR